MESEKIWKMRKRQLNPLQREYIVGALLSDDYLMPTTKEYSLRSHHGERQKEYIEWKYKIMKSLVNTPPKWDGHGYYFRTVSNLEFDWYKKIFYGKDRKRAPKNIKDLLTPLGLAVWIMDDGTKNRRCVRICTHNFNYSEHLIFQEALKCKFGIKCNIHRAKKNFWLWIISESMPILQRLVQPYFIPSMLYKLPRNDYSK